ncbi:MAG: hypothetical protein N3B18_12190, partial [Desulfobacterota bacterium]|nr:hypothetical protein [Thermodesulfobacteriota bacterium]
MLLAFRESSFFIKSKLLFELGHPLLHGTEISGTRRRLHLCCNHAQPFSTCMRRRPCLLYTS